MTSTLARRSGASPPWRRPPLRRRAERSGQSLIWLVVVALAAAPILPLLYASLRSQPYYLPGGTWTFHAYTSLLANSGFRTAVVNTVIYAACTASLAVVLGTMLAEWQVGVVGPVAALAVLQVGIVIAALGLGAIVVRRLRVAGRPS